MVGILYTWPNTICIPEFSVVDELAGIQTETPEEPSFGRTVYPREFADYVLSFRSAGWGDWYQVEALYDETLGVAPFSFRRPDSGVTIACQFSGPAQIAHTRGNLSQFDFRVNLREWS